MLILMVLNRRRYDKKHMHDIEGFKQRKIKELMYS
jgi:hypothetical protein